MGERYKGLLANTDSNQILHGYKLDDLNEEDQTTLEDLYSGYRSLSGRGYGQGYNEWRGKVREFAKSLSKKSVDMAQAIQALCHLSEDASTGRGANAAIELGDPHHRGPSHNQSIQDNDY